MKKIIPKFIYDEKNKKTGILLPVCQFEKVIEILEDYQYYIELMIKNLKKELV